MRSSISGIKNLHDSLFNNSDKMNYRYIQFPLCLVQEILKDRNNGINLCLDFGIVHYAKTQKIELTNVARQLTYDYNRRSQKLTKNLYQVIHEAEEDGRFTAEEDWGIFQHDGGFAELNITEIEFIFESDSKFKEEAILHYQLHQATEFLGVSIGDEEIAIWRYEMAKSIKDAYEGKFGLDAMPSIKPSFLTDFRDDPKQSIDLLLAYIGICSLIGQRNFVPTSKPVILSRMIGAKSKAAYQRFSKNKESKAIVERFSKRWPMDRLLLSLAEYKFIMYLTRPHVSVIYVSKYMDPEMLADLIRHSREKHNLKNKIKAASEKL